MWLFVLLALALSLGLFYAGRTWLGWVLPGLVLFLGWSLTGVDWPILHGLLLVLFVAAALIGGLKPLRCLLLTKRLLVILTPILPKMSKTERTAIEAGTVWWEGEFFTGRPNWSRLLNFQPRELTEAEQAFLDGPVAKLCAMVVDWKATRDGDLPLEAWQFLKREGFMGMIIPEEYGGLGFSAAAHSEVIAKLASRSTALAVTAMVPNSLGPAELLLHYGTDEQKQHYLPRLARGEEVPAFALTEPEAGSDAGAMRANGVVCRRMVAGEEVLGMRLEWDKRYITLAPVATVLGLAFKLRDPDHLLGETEELGITCALVPTDTAGVETGERHNPLNSPFMNGPTKGRDVFVPIDAIIGGPSMAGQGWLMLMQSLSAGRGISLPSVACAAAKLATRTAGAYATVRKQFNTSIGKFEGIEEPLARIAGKTYAMDAARWITAGAIDGGERPSVASALVKCYLTDAMRSVTNDAMDVVAGAGISLGPRNILGLQYSVLPIGITVEGANILTRTMIIFGQGAMRCHPFVQDEMRGAFERDVEIFDRGFFGHVGFVCQSTARALLLGLCDGALAGAPVTTPEALYYRKLSRLSAMFALCADFAMGTLGGNLKRKEMLTGRLADCLASLYLASAALKRFHAEGSKERDLPYVRWACEHALHEGQRACLGFVQNLPLRPAGWFLRAVCFPLGAHWLPPSDRLAQRVAAGLLDGGEAREHLTEGMYVPPADEPGLGLLEDTLEKVVRAQLVHDKVRSATKDGRLERKPRATLLQRALESGVIGDQELAQVEEAERARVEATAVDAFSRRDYAEMSA